jgi:REP element-mobilizing transposase RayT
MVICDHRVRDICRQVCAENGVEIIKGVLSSNDVHVFVSIRPKLAVSDLVHLIKERSSHKVQRELSSQKIGPLHGELDISRGAWAHKNSNISHILLENSSGTIAVFNTQLLLRVAH